MFYLNYFQIVYASQSEMKAIVCDIAEELIFSLNGYLNQPIKPFRHYFHQHKALFYI